MSNFALLETKRGKPNKIYRSAEQEITDEPHVYDPTIINNQAVGYRSAPYDREAHEYPKLVYHPKYGLEPKPEEAKFAVGAVTQQQIQNAAKAYQDALQQWMRANRTMEVKSKEDEDRLVKKGWSLTPPKLKESQRFDVNSEEI